MNKQSFGISLKTDKCNLVIEPLHASLWDLISELMLKRCLGITSLHARS